MKKNCILIASFTSWYHYLGICSFLSFNAGRFEAAFLVSQSFFGKKNIVNKEISEKYVKDVFIVNDLGALEYELCNFDFTSYNVTLASTSSTPFRLARLMHRYSKSFDVLCYEEGIGSYGNIFGHINGQIREASGSSFLLNSVRYLTLWASWVFKYCYFLKVRKSYWLNFDKKTLSINSNVVDSYRSVISCIVLKDVQKVDLLPGSIVFISSPIYELGLISKENYLGSLADFFKGHETVYIKPHPIEDVDKYINLGFLIIETDLPYELWVQSLSSRHDTYTFSSTCIYTSSIIFGNNVFRISSLDFFYNLLSVRQKKIIDKFSRVV